MRDFGNTRCGACEVRNVAVGGFGDIGKQARGNLRCPTVFIEGGSLNTQCIQYNGRQVTDIHFLNNGVTNALAGCRKGDIFLLIAPAAVTAFSCTGVGSSVVGNDDEKGILNYTRFGGGLVDVIDQDIYLMNALEMIGCTVSVSVSRAVHAVHLNKQECRLFRANIIADDGGQFGVAAGMMGYMEIVFNYAVCDRIPVTEGSERRIGHDLPNALEERREGRINGIRGRGYDAVGQAVHLGANADQHRAPTFGTDGGTGGEGAVCDGTIGKDAVKMGRDGLLDEGSGTVDADDNDMRICLL